MKLKKKILQSVITCPDCGHQKAEKGCKMKFRILILVMIIVNGMSFTVFASENGDPDYVFDGILSRYVSQDGLVSYKELKEDKGFMK